MAELNTLIKTRAQQKGFLSRAEKFLDQLHEQVVDQQIRLEIDLRLKKLSEIFDAFNDIQSQIELADPETEEDEERESFENRYYRICSQLKSFRSGGSSDADSIHSRESAGSAHHTQTPQTHDSNTCTNSNTNSHQMLNAVMFPQAQLPLLKLPTFSGEYERWVEFRDGFEALVDKNPVLSDIQKLHHLRSCLSGEALDAIKSIPIAASNYPLALNTLKQRFEKNRLIVQSHIKEIIYAQRPGKDSARDLRKFYNGISNHLQSLKNLNEPVEKWDTILVTLVSDKLDPTSRREWEHYSTIHDSYSIKDLLCLINNRCEVLEKMEMTKNSTPNVVIRPRTQTLSHLVNVSENQKCQLCSESHPIFYCSSFLKLSIPQRWRKVKEKNLCSNCLKPHRLENCNSKFKCKICKKSHNSLLHNPSSSSRQNSKIENPPAAPTQVLTSVGGYQFSGDTSHAEDNHGNILLSTAVFHVADAKGNLHKCRALLDNGAMSNIITKAFLNKLGIKSNISHHTISGIGQASCDATESATITLTSQTGNFQKRVTCLVIDNITSNIPITSFPENFINLPHHVRLADPNFYKSQPIDLLLGSSFFWQILRPNCIRIPNTQIHLQETDIGWILGGQLFCSERKCKKSINCLAVNQKLESLVSRFWEIEDCSVVPSGNKTIDECERHFIQTTKRDKDGKFIVSVPFRDNHTLLGRSRAKAEKMFYSLEKRLLKNPTLHQEYRKFMKEYIDLGHMTPVDELDEQEELNYYIPHHGVVREDSLTTKLRVVFNASMKSDSGLSLNDVQHVGPPIQRELIHLLLNFRIHEYVMTADISKMYRMIWLNPDHTKFHRIFWRDSILKPLQCYELKTVTYGTASASYLAIRCLHQLAHENSDKFPEASKAVIDNFYVDDFLCGANSKEELVRLQNQVVMILRSGGFELRKWLTNSRDLFKNFSVNQTLEHSIITLGAGEPNKTLGVAWDASHDSILYTHTPADELLITKRTILSELAQVFDPLGLLGPVIITGKILMQRLWQERVDWDSPVPEGLAQDWKKFRTSLLQLNDIRIPRHAIAASSNYIELHGFGDASQRAYGAAIYIKSKSPDGQIRSCLMCAKSRVAPLKQQTLPRLELCAAVLLSQLAAKVQGVLSINFNKLYFWSDSTVVLSWIKSSPLRWQTFVANRVGEIQRLTNQQDWYHVSTNDNPADILSRGATSNLAVNNLWWQGPSWLLTDDYPIQIYPEDSREALEEAKRSVNLSAQVVPTNDLVAKFSRFSTLTKLKRVVAYCLRFISNCRSLKPNRKCEPLSAEEIQFAFHKIIILVQNEFFPKELKSLEQGISIPSNSRLLSLNPFLHSDGLMRVGGRIRNSLCSFSKKHPIILPHGSHVTRLLFAFFHKLYFHCGPTQLLAAIRDQFWPIHGRNSAKRTVRNCQVCFKAKPKPVHYRMGDLPAERLRPCQPFSSVGVDYAGPFLLKDRPTRGARLIKGYICLFVCFSTKAVHLEVVSDLTTSCFLACLRRFVSRRGRPKNIYSDNAKTFIGAKSELNHMYNFIRANFTEICNSLTKENITWHLIPPRAPNFGGLWEAGVKGVKHHLQRVLSNTHLNLEQFNTVLCQIESILNSRPLCPLTSNPDDIEPLTPGHFLIQKSPMSLPDCAPYDSTPCNRLDKFHHLQKITHHFWNRWRREYLSQLQNRVKWREQPNQNLLQPGALVLLKEKQPPTMVWPLARITKVHPGEDGIIRVVTLKANGKFITRPVTKICILPMEE